MVGLIFELCCVVPSPRFFGSLSSASRKDLNHNSKGQLSFWFSGDWIFKEDFEAQVKEG